VTSTVPTIRVCTIQRGFRSAVFQSMM
jgi:hypothetical protein